MMNERKQDITTKKSVVSISDQEDFGRAKVRPLDDENFQPVIPLTRTSQEWQNQIKTLIDVEERNAMRERIFSADRPFGMVNLMMDKLRKPGESSLDREMKRIDAIVDPHEKIAELEYLSEQAQRAQNRIRGVFAPTQRFLETYLPSKAAMAAARVAKRRLGAGDRFLPEEEMIMNPWLEFGITTGATLANIYSLFTLGAAPLAMLQAKIKLKLLIQSPKFKTAFDKRTQFAIRALSAAPGTTIVGLTHGTLTEIFDQINKGEFSPLKVVDKAITEGIYFGVTSFPMAAEAAPQRVIGSMILGGGLVAFEKLIRNGQITREDMPDIALNVAMQGFFAGLYPKTISRAYKTESLRWAQRYIMENKLPGTPEQQAAMADLLGKVHTARVFMETRRFFHPKDKRVLGTEKFLQEIIRFSEEGHSAKYIQQYLKERGVAEADIPPAENIEAVILSLEGRRMPGRRYHKGVHEAIEAKEGGERVFFKKKTPEEQLIVNLDNKLQAYFLHKRDVDYIVLEDGKNSPGENVSEVPLEKILTPAEKLLLEQINLTIGDPLLDTPTMPNMQDPAYVAVAPEETVRKTQDAESVVATLNKLSQQTRDVGAPKIKSPTNAIRVGEVSIPIEKTPIEIQNSILDSITHTNILSGENFKNIDDKTADLNAHFAEQARFGREEFGEYKYDAETGERVTTGYRITEPSKARKEATKREMREAQMSLYYDIVPAFRFGQVRLEDEKQFGILSPTERIPQDIVFTLQEQFKKAAEDGHIDEKGNVLFVPTEAQRTELKNIQDRFMGTDFSFNSFLRAVTNRMEEVLTKDEINIQLVPKANKTAWSMNFRDAREMYDTFRINIPQAPQTYHIGITTATDLGIKPTIAELFKKSKALEKAGNIEAADKINNQILNKGHRELRELFNDIPEIKIEIIKTKGMFNKDVEPTFATEITSPPKYENVIIQRLAELANSWEQRAIHISKKLSHTPKGIEISEGKPAYNFNYYEPEVEIQFLRPLTDINWIDLKAEVDRIGIGGFTLIEDKKFGKVGISIYNVSFYGTKQKEFAGQITQLINYLNDRGFYGFSESKIRELGIYGKKEDGAVRTFDEVGGEVLQSTAKVKEEIEEVVLPERRDKLNYAKHVLERNVFSKNEIPYYQGKILDKSPPHGISHKVWQQAAKEVGFTEKNLTSYEGKYWIPTEKIKRAEEIRPEIKPIPKELELHAKVLRDQEVSRERWLSLIQDDLRYGTATQRREVKQTLRELKDAGFTPETFYDEIVSGKKVDRVPVIHKEVEEIIGKPQTDTQASFHNLIRKNLQEVNEEIKAQKEAGFIRVGVREEPISILNPKIRATFEAGREMTKFFNVLKAFTNSFWRKIRNMFGFMEDFTTTEQRLYRESFRANALTAGRKGNEISELAWVGTGGELLRKKEDSLVFHILGLQDSIERGGRGLVNPGEVTAEEARVEFKHAMTQSNKKIDKVVEKIHELFKMTAIDLVERKKISEDALSYKHYWPHQVLDYEPHWNDTDISVTARRMGQKSYGSYTRKAVGSAKNIRLDKRALLRYFAQVHTDNILDDWNIQVREQFDVSKKLSDEVRAEKFGLDAAGKIRQPIPRRLYTIDGKEYKGSQFIPGRAVFKGLVIRQDLVEQGVSPEIIVDEATRMAVLGRYHKVYLLDAKIADHLESLNKPLGYVPLLDEINTLTRYWKIFTINTTGIPHHKTNILGDFFKLATIQPEAIPYIPAVISLLKKVRTPEKMTDFEKYVFYSGKAKDVWNSGVLVEMGSLAAISPKSFWKKVELIHAWRENIIRGPVLYYQLKRAAGGKRPKNNLYQKDIEGMDNETAAGYLARNITIDYHAFSPEFNRFISGFIAPFAKFHIMTPIQSLKLAKRAFGIFFATHIAPYILAWLWNNTGDRREIEERLPPHVRHRLHLILPEKFQPKDRPNEKWVFNLFFIPSEFVWALFGLNRLPEKVTLVRAGRMDIWELLRTQAYDCFRGPSRYPEFIMSPYLTALRGIVSNRDPFTNREIVPKDLQDTWEEKLLWGKYFIEKMITPIGMMATLEHGKDYRADAFTGWLLEQPLNVTKGFGFRAIDMTTGMDAIVYDEIRDSNILLEPFKRKAAEHYIGGKPREIYIDEVLRQAQNRGINLPEEILVEHLKKPNQRIPYIKARLRETRDKKKRKELEAFLAEAKEERRQEALKDVPDWRQEKIEKDLRDWGIIK